MVHRPTENNIATFHRIAARGLLCSLVLLFSLALGADSALSTSHAAGQVHLTDAERAWLQSHHELVLAPSPDFAPIEFFDRNGRYVGATADYVRILERNLGVKFRIEHIEDRREIEERTKRGEVDIWGAASQSADRARYMRFSRPYLTFPALIIVRKNSYRNLTLDKLGGLRIVSPAMRATDAYLSEHYPGLNKILVPDVQTGLKMVSFGGADAMVVSAAPASYFIGELGLTNLAVAGQSEVVWPLCFASRRDWPLLASILQKGLDSITPEERDRIRSTWVSLRLEGYVSHRSFIMAVVAACGVVALVSTLFLLINRSLRRMVRQRTAELLQLNADLERRVLERTTELAEAKERAEAADHLKSAFLATMSHELRTPLNSIIGFTGVILQGLAGPLNDEQKKQMEMVKNSSSHLLALVNDVLDLSKIEAGQLSLENRDFDLAASLEKVVKTVQPQVDSKGLSLEVDIAPEVGMIRNDQRRVEQILLNLLSNAIKFTEAGRVTLTCGISGGVARISVSDTGIGIKQDDLVNLFKPFRQLESGLARRFEGTGLGLSICKKLVEQMGGEIRVESTPGEGSTFFVTLPVAGSVS